ncbi:MAG: transglutaminase TgpA family protein [Acidiferrobacter sp.]
MAQTNREPPKPLPGILVALMGASFLPLVGELPWWAVGAAYFFLAWRYAGVRYLGWPSRPLLWLLALLVMALALARFHTIMGERPGVSFLLMLAGLKCLEARSRRDWVILVFLSYMALLGGVLFRPTLVMGVYSLGFLAASFVTLSVIAQPLGLSLRARGRQSLVLLLQAIPLALIAYVVFPRIAGGLWHSAARPVGQTGLTSVLRPGSLDALLSSRKVAMRVIFHGPRPPKNQRYFRAYVLTATNGRMWDEGAPLTRRGTTVGHPVWSYTVLLNATGNRVMPALDWPVLAPERSEIKGGGVLRAQHAIRRLLRYQLQSAPIRRDALTGAERKQDLALPADLDPRIRALAKHLSRNAADPETIVRRTLDYFVRHHFVYTLTPPAMGRDPVGRFLFRVRAGYCEDYAAAFATLMRAAGVPTRVVVGFLGGEFNPDGGDVIVRNWDAHSWAEVWAAGRWRRVDPTAVVAPGALREGVGALRRYLAHRSGHFGPYHSWWITLHRHFELWRDAATTNWDNWVIDYNWRRQEALLKRLGWRNADRASLAVATLALLVLLVSLVKTFGGRTRATYDPVQRIYARYCRRLAKVGLPRRASEGPWDYGARTQRARPDLRVDTLTITQSYIDARYAQKPGALIDLKRQVRHFRPRRLRA